MTNLANTTPAPYEYSRALEAQCETLRWMASPQGEALCRRFVAQMASRSPTPMVDMEDEVVSRLGYTIARPLLHGAPHYWAPHMCELLRHLAPTVPDTWEPTPEAGLEREGFAWFASPLPLPDWKGRPEPMTAFSWVVTDGHSTTVPANTLCFTVYTAGPLHAGGEPTHYSQWTPGHSLREVLAHHASTAEYPERTIAKIRSVAAACALMMQRLCVPTLRPAARATRRRLEAAGATAVSPLVRVIVLRRTAHPATNGRDGAQDIAWSCQWIVRGHWRAQWCPARGRHLPMWILPHVKGPEDKPLRPPRAQLFAVIR
jgi:hypothetical protein